MISETFPTISDSELTVDEKFRLLAGIIDSNLDGAVSINCYSEVIEWNKACSDIFKWTREEALGSYLHSLIIPQEQVQRHLDGMRKFLHTGESHIIGRRIRIIAVDRDGRKFPVELAISHILISGKSYFTAKIRDISEAERNETRINLLNRELFHRSGNDMAIVLSLMRNSDCMSDAISRVEALGKTLEVIRLMDKGPVDLRDIAKVETEAYAGQVVASGPRVMFKPHAAQTLGLCIHEMLTNAVKHGSLSGMSRLWRRRGRVQFTWHVEDSETLVMDWVETGGPDVSKTVKMPGFGSRLVKDGLKVTLGGTMSLDYRKTGLVAQTRIPIGNVVQL